jgi:4-alpha-glucanotransferase
VIGDPSYLCAVRDALHALGVRRLTLAIHDGSFPCAPDDDTGRGTPYSSAGVRFLRFVHDLGFNGVQLGPQGQTPDDSASPYDGTVFSRNLLSISLARLTDPQGPWAGILALPVLRSIVESGPGEVDGRVPYAELYRAHHEALRRAFAAFEAATPRSPGGLVRHLRERFDEFKREQAAWLEQDVSYERLRGKHGAELEFYRFGQFLAHDQHRLLREEIRELCLKLYGDLQIGLSDRDAWKCRGLFLPGYVMGAPPSRTNPTGQAWHYPVFDPEKYFRAGNPGPVLQLLSARMDKMFAEFDAIRIDHPHGLVCPWVYRADEEDPAWAVQRGARLFSSPDLPDHPGLAQYAIAIRCSSTSWSERRTETGGRPPISFARS